MTIVGALAAAALLLGARPGTEGGPAAGATRDATTTPSAAPSRPGGPGPGRDERGQEPTPFADTMTAARAALARREDPAQLAEACARLALAASFAPADREPLLLLARAQAFRAQAWPGQAREAWREAAGAAERALGLAAPAFAERVAAGEPASRAAAAVERSGAEALYWLGLSTLGMGQARGTAALLAVKDEAQAFLARAAALDERVDSGGPRRALGALLATVPSAAGGGAAAARAELERARALAPDYQLTRVRDAEVLAVLLQDGARFDALLAEVLAFEVSRAPDLAPENRLAQRLARDLLKRRDRLF